MVKIFDITADDNRIRCYYTPENTDLKGFVEIDRETLEITKVKYSEFEYGKRMYVAHVRSKISELIKANKPLPKETYAIWY